VAEVFSRRTLLAMAGVVGGLALVPAAAGTALASPPPGSQVADADNSLTWDAINSEYRSVVDQFSYAIPQGYAFPEVVPLPRTTNANWERGSGEVAAYVWWLTAIQHAALRAVDSGDFAGASQHLRTATDFLSTDAYGRLFKDPERTWERTILLPATQAGDFAPMRASLEGSGFSVAP